MEIGTPTTIRWIPEVGRMDVVIKDSGDVNVVDLISTRLSIYRKAKVFLSGGIDSEIMLILALRSIPSVTAHVFAYTWQGVVINGHDVINAQRIAQKHGVLIDVSTHELDTFLDTKLVEVALEYHTPSPQIAAHLDAAQNHVTGADVFLFGGEVPFVYYDDKGVMTFLETHRKKQSNLGYIVHSVFPFYYAAQEWGVEIIRNVFMLSPQILFAAIKQNLQLYNHGQGVSLNPVKRNYQLYRQAYYDSLSLGVTTHPVKRTGFEEVKLHLASLTGNYDEFDRRYRKPLKSVPNVDVLRVKGDEGILNQCFKNLSDIKPLNTYSFDW